METPGKVSIFAGHFADVAELEEYTFEDYGDDDDVSSIMWDELGIDWFDQDFQEIVFYEKPITADDLRQFSYANTFVQHVKPEDLKGFNALILLYDFQAVSVKDDSALKFIGVFDYTK